MLPISHVNSSEAMDPEPPQSHQCSWPLNPRVFREVASIVTLVFAPFFFFFFSVFPGIRRFEPNLWKAAMNIQWQAQLLMFGDI